MIRLLCVEDDPLVRTYLATRLSLEPDVRVQAVVSSAGEALAYLRQEPVDVILLGEVLPQMRCSVTLAWRGEDVLRFLERERFDLLLLDHHLAGQLFGGQVLEEVARRWPELPVLFVTGLPAEVERYKGVPNLRGV